MWDKWIWVERGRIQLKWSSVGYSNYVRYFNLGFPCDFVRILTNTSAVVTDFSNFLSSYSGYAFDFVDLLQFKLFLFHNFSLILFTSYAITFSASCWSWCCREGLFKINRGAFVKGQKREDTASATHQWKGVCWRTK